MAGDRPPPYVRSSGSYFSVARGPVPRNASFIVEIDNVNFGTTSQRILAPTIVIKRMATDKKMQKIKMWLLMLLLCASTAQAKYTADFLNLGAGARALGMGGTGTATTNDATAIYWNPAGMGHRDSLHDISVMSSTLNGLAAYTFVSYSHPVSDTSSLGISWLRVGVDDIPITGIAVASKQVGPTNRPEVIGTFSNTHNAFLLAGGWRLPSLSRLSLRLGGTLKLLYIDSYRNTNAIGGGGDIGFLMTYRERVTLGIRACDIFTTKLYWNTPPATAGEAPHTETILPHVKFGIAATQPLPLLDSTLTLACDVYTQHGAELHAGAELTLFELLALRIGIDGRNGIEQLMQVTAGVGLQLRFVTGAAAAVDYAWTNHPALGGSHRMSFQMGF